MTVQELIELLQAFPGDLPVCYDKYSEYCLLDEEDLRIKELQPARADGWVHDARPDKPKVRYLVLPGN